jgi:putative polymerase
MGAVQSDKYGYRHSTHFSGEFVGMANTEREQSIATFCRDRLTIGERLGPILTLMAVLYNCFLCFANTMLLTISPAVVISAEVILIGSALIMVWYRSFTLNAVLIAMAAYFYTVMMIRSQFDPKILRDVLIPIAFFFLGCHFGTLRVADRLVTVLIVGALGAALFEWLEPAAYAHYFDVARYYIERGTAGQEQHQFFGGFFNSARFQNRTLLPILGDHRVSGIFLEAPSVGNFAGIVFAWILLRPKRLWSFTLKTIAVVMIVVLADARFGLYFCVFVAAIYPLSRYIPRTLLFIGPFAAMIALVTYATAEGQQLFNNDMVGRFLYAGQILSKIYAAQVFGLGASDISTGTSFASDPVNDSAYTYVLVEIGILGSTALWALFIYSPVADRTAWRFKTVVAFYYILILTIAASAFTIKTAALLWFLYGTLNRRSDRRATAGTRWHEPNRTQAIADMSLRRPMGRAGFFHQLPAKERN